MMFELLMKVVEIVVGGIAFFALGATGLLGSGIASGLRGVAKKLWGDINDVELYKFGLLSVAFFLVVGDYWMLRVVKDAFLDKLIGFENQPMAKLLSLVVSIVSILVYGKLSDWFDKTRLFWVVCSFYAISFFAIGFLYSGIDMNAITFFGRSIGMLAYLMVESSGSIVVAALYWGFVASVTKTDAAKRGYPIIFLIGQFGNFFGVTIVAESAETLGFANLFYLGALALLLVPVVIQFMLRVTPPQYLASDSDKVDAKKGETGVFEGLRLFGSRGYLMGIAVITTVFSIVGVILDFQFKMLVKHVYVDEAFAAYMGRYGQVSSLIGIVFAFVGTGYLLRNLGISLSLLCYPVIVGLMVALVWFQPTLGYFFTAMVVIKAFSYVLNNPTKEILYIPTSRDVKFKAKGFIESFGQRFAKGTGSAVTLALKSDMTMLLNLGCLFSLGIVGFWIVVAIILGNKYNRMQKTGEIIS